MYRLFVLTAACSFLIVFQLAAQEKVSKRALRQATAEAVSRYQLTADQALTMEGIQTQRLANLAAIESLKGQNYNLYLQKRKAIRLYTEAATLRLLTPSQLGAFELVREAQIAREEALLKELKNRGAAPDAIERALLELEDPTR